MTNVQADIQVDAGNNAWLLTLPEVRIEGKLFEECTVVAVRTLKDSWYHPDGENYSGPRTLAGRECQISLSGMAEDGGRSRRLLPAIRQISGIATRNWISLDRISYWKR
ncbi:TPA: hypothetical protein MAZ98_005367 [Klebsiella pneumoniae]|nr:hypothetical protein [Klebsiella pneumoniae]